MTKKRVVLVILLLLIISFAAYRFYLSKPQAFVQQTEIIQQLKQFEPTITVQSVEDIIRVDDSHYFVPILAEDGQQASLLYQWRKGKWQIDYVRIGSSTFMHGWQLDANDPRSIVFVWHFPKDAIDSVDIYLLRKRNAFDSNGHQHYVPQIQLKETLHLNQHYGVQPMSQAFSETLHQLNQYQFEAQPSWFNTFTYQEPPQFYAKYVYKEAVPHEADQHGYATGFGTNQFHYIISVTEELLE